MHRAIDNINYIILHRTLLWGAMDFRCSWLPTTLEMDLRKMLECWLSAVLLCLPLPFQLRFPTLLFLPNILLWNVFLHYLLLVTGTILSFPFLLQSILPPLILSNSDSWGPLYNYFLLLVGFIPYKSPVLPSSSHPWCHHVLSVIHESPASKHPDKCCYTHP